MIGDNWVFYASAHHFVCGATASMYKCMSHWREIQACCSEQSHVSSKKCLWPSRLFFMNRKCNICKWHIWMVKGKLQLGDFILWQLILTLVTKFCRTLTDFLKHTRLTGWQWKRNLGFCLRRPSIANISRTRKQLHFKKKMPKKYYGILGANQ